MQKSLKIFFAICSMVSHFCWNWSSLFAWLFIYSPLNVIWGVFLLLLINKLYIWGNSHLLLTNYLDMNKLMLLKETTICKKYIKPNLRKIHIFLYNITYYTNILNFHLLFHRVIWWDLNMFGKVLQNPTVIIRSSYVIYHALFCVMNLLTWRWGS